MLTLNAFMPAAENRRADDVLRDQRRYVRARMWRVTEAVLERVRLHTPKTTFAPAAWVVLGGVSCHADGKAAGSRKLAVQPYCHLHVG